MSNGARRVLLTLDIARSTSKLREWIVSLTYLKREGLK